MEKGELDKQELIEIVENMNTELEVQHFQGN